MERSELVCTSLRSRMQSKFPGCSVDWSRDDKTSTVDFILRAADGKQLVHTVSCRELMYAHYASQIAEEIALKWNEREST